MRVLDLFSGIGGFSYGLEKAGFKTVAFCEIDSDAQKVLKKHWPEIPIFDDVKSDELKSLKNIDIICGGFPCQDISEANTKGKGLEGIRSGLWFEYLKLIENLEPKYVIVENVQALRKCGLDIILRNLNAIGYDAEWHCIQASSIGAPHRRDRLWIIAYPHGVRREPILGGEIDPCTKEINEQKGKGGSWNESQRREYNTSFACIQQFEQSFNESAVIGMDDGISKRLDIGLRLKQCGNSIVPKIAELIGEAIKIAESEKSVILNSSDNWIESTTRSENSELWKCDECDKISKNFGITNHQKISNHIGRTLV